jgi:hypothetical protein
MNKIENMLKTSALKAESTRKEYRVHGTDIFIKDPLPEHIDIRKVIRQLEFILPVELFQNVDVVYVGQFDEFVERNINAFYSDGALYITNDQTDHNDMVDDFVHEVAHAVEDLYGDRIYSDGSINHEFLSRRELLKNILISKDYDVSDYDFSNPEYSRELDEFLYMEVGYEKLNHLIKGLFVSPYALTSLREYFATAFEEYFLGDRRYLSHVSSRLFNKISDLVEIGD